MSEKAKAKKTRPIAKKKPRKRAVDDGEPVAAGPAKSPKAKKKLSRKATVKTPTTKKKTTKKAIAALVDVDEIEAFKNPPLEEIFAKADDQAKTSQEQNMQESELRNGASHGTQSKVDSEEFNQNLPSFGQIKADDDLLKLKLSRSLMKKLHQQAEDEGLSIEDFVSELLAESVVLRAWEIVERKNQMRQPSGNSVQSNQRSQNMGNSGSNHGNNSGRGGNRRHRGGMSHGRYQSIMDDKATFLEYVRNQERSRR